tara:strand:+ start:45 stop:245 length:201 start_codon:yes stop_codon:yes gene_type:complete
MAYVADERYNGYFQKNLNLWDIVVGITLVQDGGGKMNKVNLKTFNNIKVISSTTDINEKPSIEIKI